MVISHVIEVDTNGKEIEFKSHLNRITLHTISMREIVDIIHDDLMIILGGNQLIPQTTISIMESQLMRFSV